LGVGLLMKEPTIPLAETQEQINERFR